MPRLNGIAHVTKPFRNRKKGECAGEISTFAFPCDFTSKVSDSQFFATSGFSFSNFSIITVFGTSYSDTIVILKFVKERYKIERRVLRDESV